ncbi:LLM class F420-dependent oxidoreductase [Blastococcus sp. Marseille-P5729]|uniref:LLM class F420-dependent oxidoreductase n=1 Tax=Blastococcus sp. Marseille-P5729 TaxID=2086582 RepID=UPI000D10CF40|nr:LLM class F420-dependent oxidoreductase [Blastococcus sp. Marseille-P5729]
MTASRTIRVGVQLQPQHADYAQIRDAVRRAEDLGVDIAFNWDHFFPLYGAADGKHFECWTMLAAWAEQTSRIEIGALVTCNAYRNPQLVADMARTVDHISDGRLILGMGSGWFEKDFDEYDFEFKTAGRRLDDLRDALPLIEARLNQLNPPPTREIPVLIGGGGEKKTLRLVAQYADIWHTFAQGDELAHKIDVLKRHCHDIGRKVEEIEISVGVDGRGREGRALDDPEVEGRALLEAGVSLFTIGVGGPDYDLAMVEKYVGWRDQLNG